MVKQRGPFTILMADDDADDCLLAQEALGESGSLTSCRSSATGSSCWITCETWVNTRKGRRTRGPT